MPDRPAASSGQQQGRGLGGTLKSKMGPLPLWGWLAIMTAVALAYYLWQAHKNAQQAPTPAAAGAPGVTVINQGDLPPTSPPPEPPKPKGKDDDDKSKGSGDDKKDDSEEAQDDKSGSGSHRGGQGHRHHGARHH